MNRTRTFLSIVLIGFASTVCGRTWTSSSGREIEAKLVRVKGDKVYLKSAETGKTKAVSISQLCEADQEFIKKYQERQAVREQEKALAERKVEWLDDYDNALAESQKYGLPILLLYTAPEWCGYCVSLENNVLNTDDFEEYAKVNCILYIADFSNSDDAEDWKEDHPDLFEKLPCSGYPCAYLITADGSCMGRISGYDSNWSVADYTSKLTNFKNNAQ